MDLQHFVDTFKNDPHIGNAIGLYIIASKNVSPSFQQQNFCRCVVAGSRETANIDRSVTPSGKASKASSMLSRTAMYLANNIQSMNLIACLVLPPSVVNAPSGPIITRILQERNPGDARPDYALKGKTMATALETVYHINLDKMPNVSRARRQTEWFKTTQTSFANVKLALQAVGHGTFYDFTKVSPTASPDELIGKGVKLTGGQVLNTTAHTLKNPGANMVSRLTPREVAEIRAGTEEGDRLLAELTRIDGRDDAAPVKPPVTTNIRMTRSQINALRNNNEADEQRRRRVARVLAQLA